MVLPTASEDDIKRLKELVAIPFQEDPPAERVAAALASPPFVGLPGAVNMRDCGALLPQYLAPGKVYRSATLDFMPAESRRALRSQLGIKNVYDLRRLDEVKRPAPADDGGPKVTLLPYMDGKKMPNPTMAADFAARPDGSLGPGHHEMHEDILAGYATGYRVVFEALRDAEPDEAILYHCTGGKDRTGVLSALILDLMGAPGDAIGMDYSLTKVGGVPLREKLLPLAGAAVGVVVPAGLTSRSEVLGHLATIPGVMQFFSTEPEVMAAFVEGLRANHGGAEGYLKKKLGFEDEDIQKIRRNLAPSPQAA